MAQMMPMDCAICEVADSSALFEAKLPDVANLDFSARRSPTRSHCRMVRCKQCGLIYSNPYFAPSVIHELYSAAGYIHEPQLENMARDYYAELIKSLPSLAKDARILEVGCGNGFFLKLLRDLGYRNIAGIEPGEQAVRDASPEIRPVIRNEFFDADRFEPSSFDLICCFQVFDHVTDPNDVVRQFAKLLRPGGHVFAINHNIRSMSARLLGERSPMYDVEHVYLFDRRTIALLFQKHGFGRVRARAISNGYALGYFLKMLPLPPGLKRMLGHALTAVRFDGVQVRLPGGNMATIAQRN